MNLCKAVVLVAPLDWGLGHATRCIPIIRELLNQNATVLCSAQGRGGAILKREFPALKFVDIPGYQFVYPEKGSMAVSILKQLPNFLISIKNEHAILAELIETHLITHVISDNRYGLYSKKVKSVFITHQVKIKSSRSLWFLEPILFHANKKRIEKFDELWIPDEPLPNNLSGTLSDSAGINIPVKHIGILSRFKELTQPIEKVYDVIALLSGPEPQRTLLEKKLSLYFNSIGKSCLLVGGVTETDIATKSGNVQYLSAIKDEEFIRYLHPDTLLICRPGYSTLMDLVILGHQKVVFIPTPGQTEQEYLGTLLVEKFNYFLLNQEEKFPITEIRKGKKINIFVDPLKLKREIESYLLV